MSGASLDGLRVAHRGRLRELDPDTLRALTARHATPSTTDVGPRVSEIVADVRTRGDEALHELALELDGVELEALEVPRAACREALAGLDSDLRAALEAAADAIERVHRSQLPDPSETRPWPGVTVGRRPVPLSRVGAYVPGGRAAYPSSLLMCAVPARVAGVNEVVVCSPPGPDGRPSPVVRAAAALADVDRLFALGGAGAIAAMAYGTATVPEVDKIVGPGNAWVEEAKLQVARSVAIDCPAGPSEVLVIASAGAAPDRVAAELLAQAEHDPAARVVLLATEEALVERVVGELTDQLARLDTAETARTALEAGGALLVVDDLEQALELAERWGPEHLLLAGPEASDLAHRVRRAGSVFVGAGASVAQGDYATGGNHVLPTGGRARSWSGLGVLDFVRWVSWQHIDPEGATRLAPVVKALAEAEGLPAHAEAARRAASTVKEGTEPTAPEAGPDASRVRAVPPGIRATRRYDPGRRECPVELSDNTNLFGSAPAAMAALREGAAASVRRYPTVYGDRLKEAIADWLGVEPTQVATGCGSDDLLDSAFHAFAGGGGEVAYSDPTFSMVRSFGTMNDVRLRPVPTDARLAPDLEGLFAGEPDVVYLCRPDNPSGHVVAEEALLARVRARRTGMVVLDEAYAAFAHVPSLAPRAPEIPGLIALGTFSKAWGLAGLRVGYAVAAEEAIDLVERARGPYKLNGLAEAAATAALGHDREWLAATVEAASDARGRLQERLAERGYETVPSGANFLLVRVADAEAVASSLRQQGVGVRPFVGLPGGDGIRVTVGPPEAANAFLAALDGVDPTTAAAAQAREPKR